MAVLTVEFEVGVPRQDGAGAPLQPGLFNQDWLPRGLGVGQPWSSRRASTTCR
jgi:hypothetical protein